MTTNPRTLCARTILLGLLSLFVSCASPKIDWASRVGTYTFDQAILELGPPDKSAQLTDGSWIAEWYSRRDASPRVSFGLGAGVAGGHTAVGVGQTIGVGGGGHGLRLTFDKDRKLTGWSGRYP